MATIDFENLIADVESSSTYLLLSDLGISSDIKFKTFLARLSHSKPSSLVIIVSNKNKPSYTTNPWSTYEWFSKEQREKINLVFLLSQSDGKNYKVNDIKKIINEIKELLRFTHNGLSINLLSLIFDDEPKEQISYLKDCIEQFISTNYQIFSIKSFSSINLNIKKDEIKSLNLCNVEKNIPCHLSENKELKTFALASRKFNPNNFNKLINIINEKNLLTRTVKINYEMSKVYISNLYSGSNESNTNLSENNINSYIDEVIFACKQYFKFRELKYCRNIINQVECNYQNKFLYALSLCEIGLEIKNIRMLMEALYFLFKNNYLTKDFVCRILDHTLIQHVGKNFEVLPFNSENNIDENQYSKSLGFVMKFERLAKAYSQSKFKEKNILLTDILLSLTTQNQLLRYENKFKLGKGVKELIFARNTLLQSHKEKIRIEKLLKENELVREIDPIQIPIILNQFNISSPPNSYALKTNEEDHMNYYMQTLFSKNYGLDKLFAFYKKEFEPGNHIILIFLSTYRIDFLPLWDKCFKSLNSEAQPFFISLDSKAHYEISKKGYKCFRFANFNNELKRSALSLWRLRIIIYSYLLRNSESNTRITLQGIDALWLGDIDADEEFSKSDVYASPEGGTTRFIVSKYGLALNADFVSIKKNKKTDPFIDNLNLISSLWNVDIHDQDVLNYSLFWKYPNISWIRERNYFFAKLDTDINIKVSRGVSPLVLRTSIDYLNAERALVLNTKFTHKENSDYYSQFIRTINTLNIKEKLRFDL